MRNKWRRFKRSIKFIWNHPLTREQKFNAILRYLLFHLSTRIYNSERSMPFIENTKILIKRDLSGAATNYFTYLADFEEMSFLLHLLRSRDLFYDIGCNVGTYTVLASAAVGCRTIAIEPVKETYVQLLKNIDLNRINKKVSAYNFALGEHEENVNISIGKGALNRIVIGKQVGIEVVKQKTLDEININKNPRLLKMDVEGYEMNIIQGGIKTLSNPELHGLIIELNGSSKEYGSSDIQIHHEILGFGFTPICYDPFKRELIPLDNYNTQTHNTIYVRDLRLVEKITKSSKKYRVGKYNI